MLNYQTVRGTKDLYGTSAKKFAFIEKITAEIAMQYGFTLAVTPIFEFASLFLRNLGETSDIINKEMYLFKDRGGEDLALRPEGTASIVRMLLSNSLSSDLPAKFFYFGAMFRYERPQKGRQRQFHQFGVEHFAAKTPASDALAIKMAVVMLEALGVSNYEVLINSLGDDTTIINYKAALVKYLQQYEAELSEDSQKRLISNPLRILDSKNANDKLILEKAPIISDFYNQSSKIYFQEVLNYLTVLGVNYKITANLVRGLDYYTSTVFEITTTDLGSQDAILAGGRYDNLTAQMGGNKIEAIGFAAGIERLMLLVNDNKISLQKQVAVLCNNNSSQLVSKALLLIEEVKCNNIALELIEDGDNLSKKLKKANKRNFDFSLIIGEDEIVNNYITIKNMKTGEQQQLLLEQCKAYIVS